MRTRSVNQLKKLVHNVEGVAAIEFAILIPLLLAMLICAVDLGTGLFRLMQVQNSAQAGAQYAIVQSFDSSAISNVVVNATGLAGISAVPVPKLYCGCGDAAGITTVSCGSTCPAGKIYGQYVSVSAQANYSPLLPYPLIAQNFTLTAQADVRMP